MNIKNSIANAVYKRFLISLSLVLSLGLGISACAVHSTKFECKPGQGVGCKSVSKVNKMVSNKEINDSDDEQNGKDLDSYFDEDKTSSGLGMKKRIWLAPVISSNGSKSEESYIEVGVNAK